MEVVIRLSPDAAVPENDWAATPLSVKQLLGRLMASLQSLEERIADLEEENQLLRERLNQNSSNSSKPPSSDGPGGAGGKPKADGKGQKAETDTAGTGKTGTGKDGSGKRRGGQPGHEGHTRKLFPVEQCQTVTNLLPRQCSHCGEALSDTNDEDPEPYRHQVVDIPKPEPHVEEYRLHQLTCQCCGAKTRASLPEGVEPSGYGPGVVATVAVLSGVYRASERLTQEAMADLFGVPLSLGTVEALRQEASQAVAQPVEEAHEYVKQQDTIHADETGFPQGNADGLNPTGRKGWMWVAATALVAFFMVSLNRGQVTAKELLGEGFAGNLVSDRWNAYNGVRLIWRQLCWSHLKREFTRIFERPGESARIGKELLEQEKQLFKYWHQLENGEIDRKSFQEMAQPIRQKVKALLEKGAAYEVKSREKSTRAKTCRTCRDLLKVEPAMWLFVEVKGLQPTNNMAERLIRPVVIWRKTSFGSQSQKGSEFAARMLTVVTTLRLQQRNVFDYMIQASSARRHAIPAPSLLPSASHLTALSLSPYPPFPTP